MAVKPNYKYITKIPLGKSKNGRPLYRYFYTRQAYQAYLNSIKNQKQEIANKKLNTTDGKLLKPKLNVPIDKPLTPKQESVNKKLDITSINSFISKLASNNSVSNKISNMLNNTVESLKSSVDKGKKAIESLFDDKGDKSVNEMWTEINNESNQTKSSKPKMQNEEKKWFELKPGKEETIKDEYDLPLKSQKTTKDEDMAATNPNYNTGDYGYTHNCASCTLAYDLRRRGYDVQAASDIDSESISSITEWYKQYDKKTGKYVKPETTRISDLYEFEDIYKERTVEDVTNRIERDILKHGDGARGHFMVKWKDGGGHDMAWEVENGKVVIYDTQINQKRTVKEIMELSVIDDLSGSGVQYFRSDNLEVDITKTKTNIVKRNAKTSQERKERKHKRDQLNNIAKNIRNSKKLF